MSEEFSDVSDVALSAWLDDELADDERTVVAAALDSDPQCRAALAELDETRSLVRGLAMADPPAGFLASLLDEPAAPVAELDSARRRRSARRITAAVAGIAAAAAVAIAIVVPGAARVEPTLAADVRVHQAGVAASGDPVSGLAPLAHPVRFGR